LANDQISKNWTYVSVDVDDCGDFAAECNVSAIPEIQFR
jgi:hypothetical protein